MTLPKVVEKRPHYRVNSVQFGYCWDWGTSPLYGIWRFTHFRGFGCTQTHVNAFGTEQTVLIIVVAALGAVRRDSTVLSDFFTNILQHGEKKENIKMQPSPNAACPAEMHGPVMGIIVLEILVHQTKIFAGKL